MSFLNILKNWFKINEKVCLSEKKRYLLLIPLIDAFLIEMLLIKMLLIDTSF